MTTETVVAHTPGPWTASYDVMINGTPSYRIDSDTVKLMASMPFIDPGMHDEVAANARLIAAAPTMLETLHAVDRFLGTLNLADTSMQAQVQTAIAIAEEPI